MASVGLINRLRVSRVVDFGVYLDDGEGGDILLPRREIPKNVEAEPDAWLDVFVYHDSEDRRIATGRTPRVKLGQFAALKVVDINRTGIFLDWGLSKDLFMPHSEQKRPLQVGDWVVVHAYQDKYSARLLASAKLESFAKFDATESGYQPNDAVELLVTERTEHGYMCLVDNQWLGLLHAHEALVPVRVGQKLSGYIRELRADGRLSLSLQMHGQQVRDALSEQILVALDEEGGRLGLSDKSSAAAIAERFGVSKGNYKKTIGQLYKQGLIEIFPDHIKRS